MALHVIVAINLTHEIMLLLYITISCNLMNAWFHFVLLFCSLHHPICFCIDIGNEQTNVFLFLPAVLCSCALNSVTLNAIVKCLLLPLFQALLQLMLPAHISTGQLQHLFFHVLKVVHIISLHFYATTMLLFL